MKLMPAAMAVAAVAVLLLSGCPGPSPEGGSASIAADPDGVPCPDTLKSPNVPAVYVEIDYAVDGTPSAHPDQCYVDAGTKITWRDPQGKTTAFNLVFADRAPTERALPQNFAATQAAGRYKVSITAHGQKGENFKYGIQANGKTIDPAIIIK